MRFVFDIEGEEIRSCACVCVCVCVWYWSVGTTDFRKAEAVFDQKKMQVSSFFNPEKVFKWKYFKL